MSAYMVDKIHVDLLVDVALHGPRGRAVNPGTAWHGVTWPAVDWAELDEMGAHEAHAQFHGVSIGGIGYGGREDYTPDGLGLMLVAENLASIHARYPDTIGDNAAVPGPIDCDWADYAYTRPPYRLNAVETLKALDGYEYQACEHAGWRTSEARRFCDALRHAVACALPGYDEAAWTWTAELVARRRAVAS